MSCVPCYNSLMPSWEVSESLLSVPAYRWVIRYWIHHCHLKGKLKTSNQPLHHLSQCAVLLCHVLVIHRIIFSEVLSLKEPRSLITLKETSSPNTNYGSQHKQGKRLTLKNTSWLLPNLQGKGVNNVRVSLKTAEWYSQKRRSSWLNL